MNTGRKNRFRGGSPILLTAAALVLAAASTAQAQVNVTLNVRPEVISFDPAQSPVYVLFVTMQVSGFTDDTNVANNVTVTSALGTFSGTWSNNGSGASSGGFADTAALSSTISGERFWRMVITDGVTGQSGEYLFEIDVPFANIDPEYLRPLFIDALPDTTISSTPTFDYMVPPETLPDAQYDNGLVIMYPNNPANFVVDPTLPPVSGTWTPADPLADDTYLLDMRVSNTDAQDQPIMVSTPTIDFGEDLLLGFNYDVVYTSEAQIPRLTVGVPPEYSVTYTPDLGVLRFAPEQEGVYVLFGGITATGFVDESNVDNRVELLAPDGSFGCDSFPGGGSGGAFSFGYADTAALSSQINSLGDWTLRLTDGTTGLVSEYYVTIGTPGVPADLLRPITHDLATGASFGEFPTFNFSLSGTADPAFEYNSASAGLFGLSNSYFTPAITPADTSWTPDGPIASDTYGLTTSMSNNIAPMSIMTVSGATGVGGGEPSITFNYGRLNAFTYAQVSDLVGGSAPCPADFNLDGGIDGADVEAFFEAWVVADISADTNQDGGVDGTDVEIFFNAWSNGGC
jgi:hypothetical protein